MCVARRVCTPSRKENISVQEKVWFMNATKMPVVIYKKTRITEYTKKRKKPIKNND